LLRDGKTEAFAAPREQLLDYAARLPGSRVLADHYGINNVGIAVTKGRPERLAFISAFVEDAKASGLLAGLIARGDLHGFRVAPREGA
jgi:polar amino acid transport system substrate-binding protein